MNKNRLTEQEVNEFNPTYDKPLVVESDNIQPECYKAIQITSPVHEGNCCIIDNHGNFEILKARYLERYPSQKQSNIIELFECYVNRGDMGKSIEVIDEVTIGIYQEKGHLVRKVGSIRVDSETGEQVK